MKKIFILFLCLFVGNSFASGIASNTASAPCTNTTLETYSGNSNLSADWQPNEIQLRWYNNNTLMDVQASANACTYDDTLTVPSTAPTRTGYTFAGWQVRPEMDFSTLNTNSTIIARYGKGANGTWCWFAENGVNYENTCIKFPDVTELNDLSDQEGKIIFEHGTLYFMGKCSDKSGDNNGLYFNNDKSNWAATSADLDIVTNGEKRYCWCKTTGYKPNNQSTIYGPSKQLDFVFVRIDAYVGHCQWVCAGSCSRYFSAYWNISTLRAAVLGLY